MLPTILLKILVKSIVSMVYALECCFLISWNFLVHFPKAIFLCSLDVKLWKKIWLAIFWRSSWLLGGHFDFFFTENRVCPIFQLLIDGF